MKNQRLHWLIFLFFIMCNLSSPTQAGEVLDSIKARSRINCGVGDNILGFSQRDADGKWHGFDIDFCRAVAAAVLGDADKVEFTAVRASTRFPALQTRKIDLLLRNTSWTLTREAILKVQFAGIMFYDSQGFIMRSADAELKNLDALNGQTICIDRSTTHQRNLEIYFKQRGWEFKPLVFESAQDSMAALLNNRCRAYTSDLALLTARRLQTENPAAFTIMPERISHEPISPVVWGNDLQWAIIVRWVLNTLILAEEYGVTRDNIDAVIAEGKNPLAQRTIEDRTLLAESLGIKPGWGNRAIRASGNYGEIYERNLGQGSPLKMERGLNHLWNQGGLHYSPLID